MEKRPESEAPREPVVILADGLKSLAEVCARLSSWLESHEKRLIEFEEWRRGKAPPAKDGPVDKAQAG